MNKICFSTDYLLSGGGNTSVQASIGGGIDDEILSIKTQNKTIEEAIRDYLKEEDRALFAMYPHTRNAEPTIRLSFWWQDPQWSQCTHSRNAKKYNEIMSIKTGDKTIEEAIMPYLVEQKQEWIDGGMKYGE